MKRISKHQAILLIIGALTVAMGVMIFAYPPGIFPDPAHGFQVMRSMQAGGKFNCLVSPSQDDISKNTSDFLTWWSPGQYLMPLLFKVVLGLNAGRASAVTILFCQLSGLAGFYCFFKKTGFSPLIAALSLVFIACQIAFILPCVFYNGGEILLFGFWGWFLYGCAAIKKPGVALVAFVIFAGWLGFVCKSSFMWMYAAGLLCLWIRLSGKWDFGAYFKNGVWIFLPAALSLAAIYVCFLSKGDNPAAASGGIRLSWEAVGFPLASPVLSGFSVDDLFQGLVNHPSFTPCITVAILLVLAIISMVNIVSIMRYVPGDDYRLFVIVFYLVSIAFFVMAYVRQMNISYEGRHFRLIGLLIVPGIIYLVSKLKLPLRAIFVSVCVAIAFMSYSFLYKGYGFSKKTGARGNTGIAHFDISQAALNYLEQLDRQTGNAVFVFFDPASGLEIAHNRIISIDMPPPGTAIDYYDYIYDGHAGPLYLVVPNKFSGQQVAMLQKFFPGYHNYSLTKVGDQTVYAAK